MFAYASYLFSESYHASIVTYLPRFCMGFVRSVIVLARYFGPLRIKLLTFNKGCNMTRFYKNLFIAAAFATLAAQPVMADDACSTGKSYPPTLVKSFMEGCASDASYKDFCTCTIDNLQQKMSLYDFIEIGNKEQGALEKDARFTDSTTACVSKAPAAPAGE